VSAPTVPLGDLVAYLDSYLRIRDVPDDPNAVNGLQVENGGRVGRIIAAVDGSLQAIAGAAARPGPSLLLVHHGILWDGNRPVTDRRYRRLRAALDADLALYSAHIPLDLHPEVGNNVVLARQLGLTDLDWWGAHKGVMIGVAGAAPPDLTTRETVAMRLAAALGISREAIRLIPGGPERPRRIGIITGGAGSAIGQAVSAGCDTYITGEGAAHTYFDAIEGGINVLYAGHYATETVGVMALAEHLGRRFGIPWEFQDLPTGM